MRSLRTLLTSMNAIKKEKKMMNNFSMDFNDAFCFFFIIKTSRLNRSISSFSLENDKNWNGKSDKSFQSFVIVCELWVVNSCLLHCVFFSLIFNLHRILEREIGKHIENFMELLEWLHSVRFESVCIVCACVWLTSFVGKLMALHLLGQTRSWNSCTLIDSYSLLQHLHV